MKSTAFEPARRQFLRLAGLFSLLPYAAWPRKSFAAAAAWNGNARNVYSRLGIRPLINAAGTYTNLSACIIPEEVREAMDQASRLHVVIPELHAAVGKRIAELLQVEAALVTSGAAGSLMLGTAACVAGKDQERIRRVPDLQGIKDEVIIQKSHRFGYDHAVRSVGVKLIEVETREQMTGAIRDRTAMMLFLNSADPQGKVKRAEFVEIGKKAGVPTMIDAAADTPPASRLSEYNKMGFDLVCFSGGKGLQGPQCSGLLLGRKDLIEAAYLNGSPHSDAIGRPAKVGKEEIMGLLTAVELYLKRDHQAQWKDWEQQVDAILKAASGVPGVVKVERFVPEIANQIPHGRITWDVNKLPHKRREIAKRLREGEPRIEVRPSSEDQPVLVVAVWMLQPKEYRVVARRIREVLTGASG
jgi:L-seryl-tRNA(Ser) seleniumtransferase